MQLSGTGLSDKDRSPGTGLSGKDRFPNAKTPLLEMAAFGTGLPELGPGTATSVSVVGRYLLSYALASRCRAAHERPETPKQRGGFLYPIIANHPTRLRVNHLRIVRTLAAQQPTALSISARSGEVVAHASPGSNRMTYPSVAIALHLPSVSSRHDIPSGGERVAPHPTTVVSDSVTWRHPHRTYPAWVQSALAV
uniref:Uncharacterized protein n=1 Tax=Ananas comosus var. bracteatus TaxID=296719 RepID=A0A6V7NT66_ANACO|nr:unnamed protein product [Ananas comosus var. bracteatus]